MQDCRISFEEMEALIGKVKRGELLVCALSPTERATIELALAMMAIRAFGPDEPLPDEVDR